MQEDQNAVPSLEDLPLEAQFMKLRFELVALQNLIPEMDDLGRRIMADREAQTALAILRELATNMENAETIGQIVKFDKIAIKAAALDNDWDCIEEHKKSLVKGSELIEKAQQSALKAKADLDKFLGTCQFLKVEDPDDLPGVESAAKAALFESAQERAEANKKLGAFQDDYNQKVEKYREVGKAFQEELAARKAAQEPAAE